MGRSFLTYKNLKDYLGKEKLENLVLQKMIEKK